MGQHKKFPIETYGDGNCFSQAQAHLFFGEQDCHKEVQVRIIYEAVKYEKEFLSDNVLSRGIQNHKRNENCPVLYCTYSGISSMNLMLDENGVCEVYQKELLSITKPGAFTGIWQFHQAANAFSRPIGLVYLQRTNNSV